MNRRNWILVVGLAAIGFAAGYWTGHRPSPATSPVAPVIPKPIAFQTKPKAAVVLTDTSRQTATVAQLETVLRATRTGRDFGKLFETVSTLDSNKLREAIAAAEKTTNRQTRAIALQQLLARWGQSDPAAAMQYAQTLPETNARRQAEMQVLNSWLNADPTGAEAWIRQLPAGQIRNQALSQLAAKVAESNPQAALALLDSVPAGQNRQQMLWPIFNQWAAKSPADAATAAFQLPAGPTRDSAVSAVVSTWAQQDNPAALAWVKT